METHIMETHIMETHIMRLYMRDWRGPEWIARRAGGRICARFEQPDMERARIIISRTEITPCSVFMSPPQKKWCYVVFLSRKRDKNKPLYLSEGRNRVVAAGDVKQGD